MDFIEKILGTILNDWVGKFIKKVLKAVGNLFAEPLHDFLQKGVSMYNQLVDCGVSILTADPKNLNTDIWDIVTGINSALITVSALVATILLLVNFCSTSLDVKDNMRLESVLKLYIRIGLTNFFIVNNMTVITAVLSAGNYITGKFGTPGSGHLSMSLGVAKFKNHGAGTLLIALLVVAVFGILLYSGGNLILAAYKRYFKLLLIVPYGSLAFATMAGDHDTARSARSYVKYILATFLEAAAMILILRVMGILSASPAGILNKAGITVFDDIYGQIIMLGFHAILTNTLIGETDTIIHRALFAL